MPTETPRVLIEMRYHQAAQEYLRRLPLEQIMEATPQATQREITLESIALVRAQRRDVHLFNELLVQYPLPHSKSKRKIGQVVPDNMIVVYDGQINAVGSYDIPLQPAGPFMMLDVSKSSVRKDYDENMHKYEHDLKVPYLPALRAGRAGTDAVSPQWREIHDRHSQFGRSVPRFRA